MREKKIPKVHSTCKLSHSIDGSNLLANFEGFNNLTRSLHYTTFSHFSFFSFRISIRKVGKSTLLEYLQDEFEKILMVDNQKKVNSFFAVNKGEVFIISETKFLQNIFVEKNNNNKGN